MLPSSNEERIAALEAKVEDQAAELARLAAESTERRTSTEAIGRRTDTLSKRTDAAEQRLQSVERRAARVVSTKDKPRTEKRLVRGRLVNRVTAPR